VAALRSDRGQAPRYRDVLWKVEEECQDLREEANELIGHSAKWAQGDEKVAKRVAALLDKADRSLETVTAIAVETSWPTVEKLDKQITLLTLRRDNLLNQYDQRRESFAGQTRQTDQWRETLVPSFP